MWLRRLLGAHGWTRVDSSGQVACVTPTATHKHRLEPTCAALMHALISVDDVQRVACGCDVCWGTRVGS
jgi:hypothetical protein